MLKNFKFLNFFESEKEILKFWEENKIFEKSLKKRAKKPLFSFYDGPPFANGLPHYGHILAAVIKDAVTRFWAMNGFRVERHVGWDCHGLPVETEIEKQLNLKGKKDIEKFGVEKFNAACRASVFRYVKEWETTLTRVGRWADYSRAYTTLDNNYMESVWWVFKKLWDAGLIYKDFRVTLYCPRCGTPLSNFEVNQGYKEIEDPSIFVKFPVKGEKNTYFLVWTTTPWTLAANVAIAINPELIYKKYFIRGEYFWSFLPLTAEAIEEISGKKLEGKEYEPFYKSSGGHYRILPADFVKTNEGTGLVHIAPAFGEEDMKLGKKNNLPVLITVDEEGKMKTPGYPWDGFFIKKADELIIKDLEKRNLLYRKETIKHQYPFCWRCDSPLLYYPLNTWYIAVTKLKNKLIKNNKKIHWVPGHIKEGRFGKWLAEARDWAFSRNRFWGCPLPIWQCGSCKNYFAIGSIKELAKNKKIDLHRPYIDKIELKCPQCGGQAKRVPEVFDCWFESGAMPYAQWHYPFDPDSISSRRSDNYGVKNKKIFEPPKGFPADFIAEGLDQTRGWFYTLHVLATALFNKPAFKNVMVNGLVLDAQGRKLSKRLRNYPEPEIIFDKYGADALRFFLLSSTPMGEDYQFSDKGVEETFRKVIDKFRNVFNFYQLYAEQRGLHADKRGKSANALDRWILARLNEVIKIITAKMEAYELTDATRILMDFIDDLSNWYLRRSRKRLSSLPVLGYVLLETSKLIAPFAPFIAEAVHLKLVKNSVHLKDWPKFNSKLKDKNSNLLKDMTEIRRLASLALAKRLEAGIKVRQPLASLKIRNPKSLPTPFGLRRAGEIRNNKELLDILKDEVNVKEIIFVRQLADKEEIELDVKITPELKIEGMLRDLVRLVQDLRRNAHCQPQDKIILTIKTPAELKTVLENKKDFLKKEINARDIELERSTEFDAELNAKIGVWPIWLGIKKKK